MQCNMPNEIFVFLQKLKINESTREENNAYFDNFLATTPKSDERQYCNKSVATPRLPNLIISLRFIKN